MFGDCRLPPSRLQHPLTHLNRRPAPPHPTRSSPSPSPGRPPQPRLQAQGGTRSFTAYKNAVLLIDSTSVFIDPNNDFMALSVVTNPSAIPIATGPGPGSLKFTPVKDYVGAASVEVQATDGAFTARSWINITTAGERLLPLPAGA